LKALVNLANRVKSLSVDDLIHELSEHTEFTDLIIELNTKNQLYDKGVDAKGERIGSYSAKTKAIKDSKGEISDHVTLLDTGQFYESFRVYLSGSNLVITANTIKDTDDLMEKYGKDILGLNEDSLTILRTKAKEILIPYVKFVLLQR
jgi:hypothetical protein